MFNYIHIPFCKSKCKYCKFASFSGMENEINRYLDHLKKEIILSPDSNSSPDSIYFGGGTPSILTLSQIKEIIGLFNINSNTEITLEMNPENIKKDYIIGLKDIGINRLSIGIQSLNNKTLKEIGRSDFNIIKKSLNILNEKIIGNVGLDFIVGLPYVQKGEILSNIVHILDNYDFIKHISIYMLEDSKYPKNWENISINKEEYLDEYKMINEILLKYGFFRYEISNFAKPGFECKHNKSYWNHSNYRGFGLSSASFIDNKRFANANNFDDYYSSKLEYEDILSESGLEIEKIMFLIRTKGIPLDKIKNKEKLKDFIKDGFLENENGRIKPTIKGIMIIDYITEELI